MPLHHLSITCSLAHPHPFSPPATSLPLPPASSRGDQSRQSKACWACSSRTWRVAGHHWGSRGGAAQGQSQKESKQHPPTCGRHEDWPRRQFSASVSFFLVSDLDPGISGSEVISRALCSSKRIRKMTELPYWEHLP